jgi:hypothetical protein
VFWFSLFFASSEFAFAPLRETKLSETDFPAKAQSASDSMESVPGAVATGSLYTHPELAKVNPVATAPGTDLIFELGQDPLRRIA